MNKKTIIGILVTVILSLIGGLAALADKEMDKKANNETIMVIFQQMKEQRAEDKEEIKEQRQDIKQIYQIIHQMLINKEKERNDITNRIRN